jgi:signal peptidase I
LIRRLLLILLLALGGAWIVRTYLFEGVWVASGSMEPTLPTGTHYFVNKLVYHLHPPLRGDIVVFKSPVDDQKGLIKRVIAVGGDQVEIHAKHVSVNGTALTEPYAVYKRGGERLVGDNIDSMSVPADCFFVLGDNRDESEDSTTWKDSKTGERIFFIHKQNLQGRLVIP